ncbi:tungsten ABC transporter substrate-binding protein [Acidaminobacter sp. JC074]|uniref:substrate-binding domain-containing protein n=1 Tax=Acidaminobacter sp. JC074 TaxID=2530199 RepID=UPI001F0EE609|nr:substrate-binding domain-containing protein [Acidaminobacter sp. JC074]MCH4888995.1 tungsten ABC transporter substrate-binding protein [Acidaminobacter sp. JC074]
MKKFLAAALIMCLILTTFMGCQQEERRLILATTTSTQNSGLLDHIIPDFEEKTGIDVDVIAVGTGAALQMGRDGEADALLVHAKSAEEEFIAEGHGVSRSDVMYNDFVIVGPKDDPAGLKDIKDDVKKAYEVVLTSASTFVSRGDDSGTHKKELSIWDQAGLEPSGDWYVEVGKGMGDTLTMADEMNAYTMTDRATYLAMMDNLDLEIVIEGDSSLFNQYGVIPVDPNKNDMINADEADEFVKWLLSKDTQDMIGEFGIEKFGQPLFIPNAQ